MRGCIDRETQFREDRMIREIMFVERWTISTERMIGQLIARDIHCIEQTNIQGIRCLILAVREKSELKSDTSRREGISETWNEPWEHVPAKLRRTFRSSRDQRNVVVQRWCWVDVECQSPRERAKEHVEISRIPPSWTYWFDNVFVVFPSTGIVDGINREFRSDATGD